MSNSFENALPRTLTFTRSILRSSFLWMTAGLAVTGAVSLFVVNSEAMMTALFSSRFVFMGLCIAELVLVMVLSAAVWKLAPAVATGLFLAYSVLNGVTLAPIYLIYTEGSIAFVFFISAGMFACMAAFGAVTKYDLTKIGSFLMMALFGVVIASVVNMFLRSSALDWITSFVAVFLFVGLTAWDTQKIKRISDQVGSSVADGEFRKIAILCALSLYLDFINLFLSLLRLFGRRK